MNYKVPHLYMKRLIQLSEEAGKDLDDYLDEIIEDHIESIILGREAEEEIRELEESGEPLPTAEESYQGYLKRKREREAEEERELEEFRASLKAS